MRAVVALSLLAMLAGCTSPAADGPSLNESAAAAADADVPNDVHFEHLSGAFLFVVNITGPSASFEMVTTRGDVGEVGAATLQAVNATGVAVGFREGNEWSFGGHARVAGETAHVVPEEYQRSHWTRLTLSEFDETMQNQSVHIIAILAEHGGDGTFDLWMNGSDVRIVGEPRRGSARVFAPEDWTTDVEAATSGPQFMGAALVHAKRVGWENQNGTWAFVGTMNIGATSRYERIALSDGERTWTWDRAWVAGGLAQANVAEELPAAGYQITSARLSWQIDVRTRVAADPAYDYLLVADILPPAFLAARDGPFFA